MNNIVGLLSIGPTVWLAFIGIAAVIVMLLALSGKLSKLWPFLVPCSLEMDTKLAYSFLRGAASTALLLFVSFAVFFRFQPFRLLGGIVLVIGLAYLAGGAAVSALLIGSKIAQTSEKATSEARKFAYGLVTLFASTLLPAIGWAVVTFVVLAGTGTLVNATLNSTRKSS